MFIRNKDKALIPIDCYVKVRDEYVKAREMYIKHNDEYLEMFRTLSPLMAVIYAGARDEQDRCISIEAEFRSPTEKLIIDWGDGLSRTILNSAKPSAVYTYASANTFRTLNVIGKCKKFAISGRALRTLESFGYMSNEAFSFFCTKTLEPSLNLRSIPDALPKHISNLDNAFAYTRSLDDSISRWDVSHVTSMEAAFAFAADIPDITFWDVDNVANIGRMFENAIDFDQDLSLWNLPLVESKPVSFDFNTPSWLKEDRQPQFGG